MFSKLLLASVASIGLLLTGPQKASAQVVYACVTSIGNIAIVAANASCLPGGTKITLSTTPGVLAGAAYQCAAQSIVGQVALEFTPSLSNINFGSAILPSGTPPWNSFLLQPGIYQIHFSGGFTTSGSNLISAIVNGSSQAGWYVFDGGVIVGDRLISVSQANTTLAMVPNLDATLAPACQLVITRLTTMGAGSTQLQ